jgi:peptide chain release factor 2
MVKDHRTGWETSDVEGVLEGDITPFMEEFLRQTAGERSDSPR